MPVVAQVAAEYEGRVDFVAVAGRSDLASTEERAEQLFGDALLWGLDDSLWDLYGARYQPITFAITADGRVADTWYGAIGAQEMRSLLDGLIESA